MITNLLSVLLIAGTKTFLIFKEYDGIKIVKAADFCSIYSYIFS